MTVRAQVWQFGPMAAWMALMAVFSGGLGSEETMRHGISWLVRHVLPAAHGGSAGAALPFPAIWTLRKMIHLSEYGVLALLARRWIQSRGAAAPALSWLAVGCCAVYAALDETHQAFVPGRTASPWDVGLDVIGASLALGLVSAARAPREALGYRLRDVAGALLGLVLAAPVMLVSAVAILVTMGSPVLYRQRRVGRGERPFTMYKFRTMNEARDARGELLPGPRRLTGLGGCLRRLSLDELPQLWNVLKGDMSLVGPRPLHVQYLSYYTPRERTRHRVRPGMTGLAQVNGRNSLDWEARLELDARYVERRSPGLDLHILWSTVGRVLRRTDVRDRARQGSLVEYRRSLVGR